MRIGDSTWREKMGVRCIHVAAYPAKICKAGVEYASLPKPHPCVRGEATEGCACYATYTPEEIDEKERKLNQMVENIGKARAAIVQAIGPERKKQSLSGRIDCPVCGNSSCLGFTYAGSYNGHIHARCSTEGCVRWME